MNHEDCITKEQGFSSSVEFVKLIEVSHEDEVKILFKDICQECGEEIGREIQRFRYDSTEDVD